MAKKYSAAAVSKGFWFQQFRKYIELYNEGKTDTEIRTLQKEKNILLAPSLSYGTKMVGAASMRAKVLPKEMLELFPELTLQDQKLINLLGILMTDRLLFEFLYEILRVQINNSIEILEDRTWRVFLKDKSEQHEEVKNFTDQTKTRLIGAYKTYLREANILIEKEKKSYINRPIMDFRLEEILKELNLSPYLSAMRGD